jgi:probable HAF family extracellular repeat protein
MKPHTWKWMPVVSLTAALAMPVVMAAQNNLSQNQTPKHHIYKLIDLGTFGGPNSFVNGPLPPSISNSGTYAGQAETAIPDPYPYCNQDCLVQHAQKWQNGVVSDLGTLPGTDLSSGATWVSRNGIIAGGSYNGLIDPLVGIPENRGVLWTKDDKIINLGTLQGGHESFAAAVNNQGQVAGWFANLIPDPFSLGCLAVCFTTQTHGFIWQNGVMRDLGTLGGPDALTQAINERGQIVGISYTSSIPNPDSGIPTIDPFLWQNGSMVDIGTLGGTFGVANFINSAGKVVGTSNLAGDQTNHAYLWDRGSLRDLGTLGGDNAQALWINDGGDVVGVADTTGSLTHDAFLWKKGVMTDLGNLGLSSFGFAINSGGQIVGHSRINDGSFRAFIWEKGGPMVDLNTLVSPASNVVLVDPYYINDRGYIAVQGVLPNGDQHAVLLVPNGICDVGCEAGIAARQNSSTSAQYLAARTRDSESRVTPVEKARNQMRQRYHVPGQLAAPSN